MYNEPLPFKVKLSKEDHNQAKSGIGVFGLINNIPGMFCYVELGKEKTFRGKEKHSDEDRRIFFGCYIGIAKTLEDLKNENYAAEEENCTITIFK